MSTFDYNAYLKEIQTRTTEHQINCTEYNGDNYVRFTVKLPDGTILTFEKADNNTRDIYYDFQLDENNRVRKEVALIESRQGQYHVKTAIEHGQVKVFETSLQYDSDLETTEPNM